MRFSLTHLPEIPELTSSNVPAGGAERPQLTTHSMVARAGSSLAIATPLTPDIAKSRAADASSSGVTANQGLSSKADGSPAWVPSCQIGTASAILRGDLGLLHPV